MPLGALLADLCEFDEADRTYHRALGEYQDVSPFAVAWVCFQLGVLWGELVPEPQSSQAARGALRRGLRSSRQGWKRKARRRRMLLSLRERWRLRSRQPGRAMRGAADIGGNDGLNGVGCSLRSALVKAQKTISLILAGPRLDVFLASAPIGNDAQLNALYENTVRVHFV